MKRKVLYSIIMTIILFEAGCGAKAPKQENLFVKADSVTVNKTLIIENGISKDALREELPKTDVMESDKYNAVNRMLCQSVEENQQSLFCIDQNTGVAYFINQGKDWYIYRIFGETVELAVALPARELYCYDGKLYFMIDFYGMYDIDGVEEGDILVYTPQEGIVELVYAAGAMHQEAADMMKSKLTVNENGIFFVAGIETDVVQQNGEEFQVVKKREWHLPFGANEPIEDTTQGTVAGWRDYSPVIFINNDGNYEFVLSHKSGKISKQIKLNLENPRPFCYCIVDDMLYCCYRKELVLIDLLTFEQIRYDCTDILRSPSEEEIKKIKDDYEDANGGENLIIHLSQGEVITGFNMVADSIWASTNEGALLCIDMINAGVSKYELSEAVSTLYTDGNSLYGITVSNQYLVKLLVEQIGVSAEGEFIELEYVVQ